MHAQNTRGSLGEQDEQASGQEDSDNGTTKLGDELVPRLRTEEVAGFQIASHVACLSSRPCRDNTGRQIEHTSRILGKRASFSNTTKDELRSLRLLSAHGCLRVLTQLAYLCHS